MTNITEKLWTKNFIILSLLNFLLTLIFFMLNTTIVLYAVETFKASPSIGGLVSGAFIIGTLVSRLFIGNLINAKNSKKILLIGLILFTLGTSLYFIKNGIIFLILTRFLHGITLGISSTVIGAIIAIIIPKSKKGEGISYFSLSTALATALGPFIGLSLSQNAGFTTIFVFCLIVSIVICITSLFFNNSKLIMSDSKDNKKEFRISNFIEIKALPISLIMFISSLCFSSVLSYINLFAIDNHLESAASLFFIVYAIAVLFSRPLSGKLLDKKGANYIVYPALILFSLSLILLSNTHSGIVLLLSSALLGLGFGNLQSCIQAITINLADEDRVGIATATFLIAFESGTGFGPSILGLLIPLVGYNGMYFSLGIVVLLTIILYHILHGKKIK